MSKKDKIIEFYKAGDPYFKIALKTRYTLDEVNETIREYNRPKEIEFFSNFVKNNKREEDGQ